ncbi:helix-turn-helix transcriptional regulator [Escherichia coli]|nr:helix-turn-helix transcriptional regulator [Escherichia coli]EHW7739617.1 helix-turn-helix transcriptional regulator [Escherichia coli]EJY0872205.1 helix-turn-helix transcriptional regulator [Escherichia coli]
MIKKITINAVSQYIEQHLEEHPVTIDELVTYTGYSRGHLQRLFRNITGISLGKYITLRRIFRAAIYLKKTDITLTNISERLCYDSQQSFTRAFKKNTGYTPQQYRDSHVLTFKNMLEITGSICKIPPPEVCSRKEEIVYGRKINYNKEIPHYTTCIISRLNKAGVTLQKKGDRVCLSNRLIAGKSNDIIMETIIRNNLNKENDTVKIRLDDGPYVCFKFSCTESLYSVFVNNIYMTALPYYGLSLKEGYDIEIIEKGDDDILHCEYMLPLSVYEEK